ncbi:MAG: DNA photolyase family protein [Saprospiraceae bacterium]|nr:DNA photolyase family protein [Saprospiraceae bacterium]
MASVSIFWFRRDLRLHDNAGLYHALKENEQVLPLFIFDRIILDKLEERADARVSYIHQTILNLQQQLQTLGSDLLVRYGNPIDLWSKLLTDFDVKAVYTNHDYESYAIERDQAVASLLEQADIAFHTFKDQVIFEKKEVTKDDGNPYTVFTPYSRKWKAKLASKLALGRDTYQSPIDSYYLQSYPNEKYYDRFHKIKLDQAIPSLEEMNFGPTAIEYPPLEVNRKRIREYGDKRNFPGIEGTSKLGLHFRFGTISIRQKARNTIGLSEVYLNELIWRDFYAMILSNFPHVEKQAFRAKYERIPWRNDEEEFKKWCEGKTGYPIVDAGMRELNATGYMHNRVRMVTASFLTKHLLIDWRWGEAYFAAKLLDFDLASNNGGWQWASGSGTDAAPYFRVFNPTTQMERFDKQKTYIKKWVPEYGTSAYPDPIVDHKMARERCLQVYKAALNGG